MKLIKLFIIFLLVIACKSKEHMIGNVKPSKKYTELPLLTNDSIKKFIEIDKKIADKVEHEINLYNPVSQHFREHISLKALATVDFKEWKRQIYIEFSLNKKREITYLDTNTSSKKLDKQLKKAFKKLDYNLFHFNEHDYDPNCKYTLVVIQENFKGEPSVQCTEKVICYTPPVFEVCERETNFDALTDCNYLYITNYVYNNIDLTFIRDIDIDRDHKVIPKFIIDEKGEVIAAKIESQNKALAEEYYKTLKSLPKAKVPAKINGEPYYYGFTFPSSVTNIVKNNEGFMKYYLNSHDNGLNMDDKIKAYIKKKSYEKQLRKKYRRGF